MHKKFSQCYNYEFSLHMTLIIYENNAFLAPTRLYSQYYTVFLRIAILNMGQTISCEFVKSVQHPLEIL